MTTNAQLLLGTETQAEITAIHLNSLIKAIVQKSIDLQNVDLDAVRKKVAALDALLDGDPNSEGFQQFLALKENISLLQSNDATHQSAIAALQNDVNNTLTQRLDQLAAEGSIARKELDDRITQLTTQHNNFVAQQIAKNLEYDNTVLDHTNKIVALETAKALHQDKLNALETSDAANANEITQLKQSIKAQIDALDKERLRAEGQEALLRNELETQRADVTQLKTDIGNLPTRSELHDNLVAGATKGVKTLWERSGIPMESGLPMPDGTTSGSSDQRATTSA